MSLHPFQHRLRAYLAFHSKSKAIPATDVLVGGGGCLRFQGVERPLRSRVDCASLYRIPVGKILYRCRSFALKAMCNDAPFRVQTNEAIEEVVDVPCCLVHQVLWQGALAPVERSPFLLHQSVRTVDSCAHLLRPSVETFNQAVEVSLTRLIGHRDQHLVRLLSIPIGYIKTAHNPIRLKISQTC